MTALSNRGLKQCIDGNFAQGHALRAPSRTSAEQQQFKWLHSLGGTSISRHTDNHNYYRFHFKSLLI